MLERIVYGRRRVECGLRCAADAGLSWPLAEEVSDAAPEAALYKAAATKTGHRRAGAGLVGGLPGAEA